MTHYTRSRATEASRSNLIALGQTVTQVYGDSFARDANLVPTRVANFLSFDDSSQDY